VEEDFPENGESCGDELQWGHGDEAVEEIILAEGCDTKEIGFNGATAMKPWKSYVHDRTGHRLGRFNGATAMKPWKSSSSRLWDGSAARLQWGHGDEAVEEIAISVRTGEKGTASMGPRR